MAASITAVLPVVNGELTDTPVIDLRDVTKLYSPGTAAEVRALGGVSLTVSQGEYVAVIGASGSGKSTLMHIIGCLDTATSGTYLLAGEDVSSLDDTDLAEIRGERIGFVFQQFNLFPHMTALQNVMIAQQRVLKRGKKEAEVVARENLEKVGVSDKCDSFPAQLSGGQQQRVAIARALANRPDLIIADEPTGQLDADTGLAVMELLRAVVRSEGVTALVATHDATLLDLADRVLELHDGEIAEH
jgi:putative ABC transport system ATP-binding protein